MPSKSSNYAFFQLSEGHRGIQTFAISAATVDSTVSPQSKVSRIIWRIITSWRIDNFTIVEDRHSEAGDFYVWYFCDRWIAMGE